jgi:hypothetical protein
VTQPNRLPVVLRSLAAVAIVGTALELAMLRHWDGLEQLVPWFALTALTAALAAATWARAVAVKWVRVVSGLAAATAAFGVWVHVHANYDAAPLDAVYGPKWDTMSLLSRWWAAVTAQVGAAPTIVPGALAYIAAMIWFSTLGDAA